MLHWGKVAFVLPTPYPHLSLTLLLSPEWLGKMGRGLPWPGHLLAAWIDHTVNEFSRGAIFLKAMN
uniref:Uncharacterized protein n=1 Tax=Piliocolobus tephrosceles TaxID=591936 RepID=A0A8C9HGA3_9PRIM